MLVLLFCLTRVGYGQRARLYADGYGVATGGILGSSSVLNPHRAIGANAVDEPVVLSASGLGGSAKLQLKFLLFGQNIPAGIAVKIKVGNNTNNFNATFRRNATSSFDVDGSNESSTTPSIAGNTITITPNTLFNAVALSINSGTSNREVYHAYIEPYTLPLSLKNTSFTSCGSIGLNEILDYSTPDLLNYQIINTATNQPISTGHFITASGTYTIKMTDPNTGDPAKASPTFSVTINPIPKIELNETYIRIPINTSHAFPTVSCSGCGTPMWVDAFDNTVTQISPRSTSGTSIYTVNMNNGHCTAQKQIVVEVYDPQNQCEQKERKYATVDGGSSSVTNKGGAYDGDPKTYSTLTSISILGLIGGADQTVRWDQAIPAGTTVYIKMGVGKGLLGLASTVSLQPKNGNTNVGSSMTISSGLIDLLVGDNEIIYSFTPASTINGVTLSMSGLLSLGLTMKLYDAWYEAPTTTCPSNDVIDVLSGSAEILKGVLNAASVTVNVQNPYNAIDNDETTYAVMNSGVGVLAYAKLDVLFSSVSQPGDSVFIKVQSGVEVLNLIGGFVIQRYLGATPVGPPLDFGGTVLTLLKGSNGENIIFTVTTEPYDRISIRYGGTANVLGQLLIYNIKRKPYLYTYPDANSKITICEGEQLNIGLNRACLSYEWYEQKTGGSPIHTSSYRPGIENNTPFIPTNTGQRTYYIEHKRNGCHFGSSGRIPFTVNVTPKPGKPHVTITNVIN